ncbi:MAG TPA: metallophosphoesterase [Fimbriimonadaceae bacterium]|nr:metallophosphoesterase [Fimbriimonadaceae bacterium]
MKGLSRRDLLVASSAGVLLPNLSLAAPNPARKRRLRIAHLTDIHVQPEKGAPKGMEAALIHAQSQKDKPNVIFTGGDLIMDSFGADAERTKTQWDIFSSVLKANAKIPVEHTVGNHDVWGWGNRAKYEKEPKFGKASACEVLSLEKPYRSFDRAGWHFVVLDSTFPHEGGYKARLDEEQFEWLQSDLASTPKTVPVMVISHIPIIAVCSMFDGENEKTGNWVIPGAWVHIDARRIKDLFKKHPNVKLCVSGHEHLIDQVVYNGVTYFCNGAVCGGWWGGDYHECTYGYALIDLFDDGSFENRYVPYGWKTMA